MVWLQNVVEISQCYMNIFVANKQKNKAFNHFDQMSLSHYIRLHVDGNYLLLETFQFEARAVGGVCI